MGRFDQLFKQGETFEEQLKFLMEAAEMVKRRLREHQKSQTARFKEVEEAEEKLSEQIAALERSLTAHKRDMKAIERRTSDGNTMAAISTPRDIVLAEPKNQDPNVHLMGVLAQLEKIATGPPAQVPQLPQPLPRLPIESDVPRSAPSMPVSAPIDSARMHGMYG